MPDLRDGAGERLWYAVSDVFKNSSQTGVLNSDTPGDFTVTGTAPTTSNAIAIVFAPGAALGSQVRDTANENNVANYLEGENANGDTIFTTALASGTFNDRLLPITRDTFFPAVEQRVARGLRQSIQSYYSTYRYYPFPAYLSSTACNQSIYRGQVSTASCPPMADLTLPSWFTANNWQQLMIYAVAPRCTPKLNSGSGSWISNPNPTNCPWPIWSFGSWSYCQDYSIDTSKRDCTNTAAGSYLTVTGTSSSVEALILSAGYGFTGQTRPCTVASSCLEDSENYDTPDNYLYVTPQRSPTDNDQMVIVAP